MEINMRIEEHNLRGFQTLTVKISSGKCDCGLDSPINLIKMYSIV
jgi:hypothetical protein